jgi:hypothetical protein
VPGWSREDQGHDGKGARIATMIVQ